MVRESTNRDGTNWVGTPPRVRLPIVEEPSGVDIPGYVRYLKSSPELLGTGLRDGRDSPI